MEIRNLTFIVTDDCNFNCSYCTQKKEKKTINNTTIETSIDFFYPYLKTGERIFINFYGGEPLLAYDKIKHALRLLTEKNKQEQKQFVFAMTTNGSLLTGEILDFFSNYNFVLVLSFDGLAQELGRKKFTLSLMEELIKKIQTYTNIRFEINSVFTPQTIDLFSKSMRFILEQGEPDVTFNIVSTEDWTPAQFAALKNELQQFNDFMAHFYKETDRMPVLNFRSATTKEEKKRGIFNCSAGRNRAAITPEGKVWGCHMFHDYFNSVAGHVEYGDYCFGTLDDFIANYDTRYPDILANYAELRQDFFQVEEAPCFLCEEIEGCAICPVNAAFTSGSLGKITRCRCELEKIQRDALRDFREKIS
jgi:sulfatase maturation enzyme AslB (radical SAM superfamily)